MASHKAVRERVLELSLGLRASTTDNKSFDLLPVIIFIVFLFLSVPFVFQVYNVVAADYYHRLALSEANRSGTKTYEYLQTAERLNPFVDLYRVDMAQTNFALANALAAQKGPTAENPNGTLTDQDRTTIQTLLGQAINEGRNAVILNPLSARNWEVLAAIYRNISGVAQNALDFSLDAYGKAIQRDPLNPALRVSVGGIYYVVNNFDTAIRFFSDAANLKADYANAYFNLSIAFRDKGDFRSAQIVAERTVALLNDRKESEDYKLAVKLVEDLKAKVSGTTQAPAAATTSALQNEQLPKVEVTQMQTAPTLTPIPTVRANPTAGIPQVNPTSRLTPTISPSR